MKYINELVERYPQLTVCKEQIAEATEKIIEMHKNSGKLLLCGNGGSCSDCEHISGELLKGFLLRRKPDSTNEIISQLQDGIPAIPLASLTALSTAFCNDVNPDLVYAQLVHVLHNSNDVFLGISTSGNSKNVVYGAMVAKEHNLVTIALTGGNDSKLGKICDITIKVPESETFKVQELHLPVYHAICAQVEEHFFK